MKINFDTQNLQMTTTTSKNSINVTASHNVSAPWEVGKSLSDNNTYDGHRKSASDIVKGIQANDVSVTQDYMTVMAHTVSGEDYGRMVKDGINPMDIEVEDSATIMDSIKLYVAKGGTEVEGFTDTLDRETLKELTGLDNIDLESLSREYNVTLDDNLAKEIDDAAAKIEDISEISDGMKVYLLSSDFELTADSLYLAKHSAMSNSKEQGSAYFGVEARGYLVKKGTAESDAELMGEVKSLFEKTGIIADPETVKNGVWLVNHSIPVTIENLNKLNKINSLSLPISKEALATACVRAQAMGKPADEADLTKSGNVYKESWEVAKQMADRVDLSLITKTRVFEEIRLKMLSEANLLLLKSDYSIDTADLEKYVDSLKKLEENAEYRTITEFESATYVVESVKTAPADVLGIFAANINAATLEDIFDEGDRLRHKYENAEKAYEQLATEVRRDLGDSIKKAFSNVDDILDDLGFEKTDENRRAVRILGYNSMPINDESIEKVKEADKKVQSILTRISPMDTLALIRGGKSPIKMSVDELNEYLDENEKTQEKEIEKYSKYLYKLERSNAITADERKQYIEVYRFFHQLEKADMAAVGSVINAGNELTISNLKTALKTAKSRGMDVTVDDSFGLLVDGIRHELEPEKIAVIPNVENMPLKDVYEELKEIPIDIGLEHEYAAEELASMREAMKAPEEVVSELLMNKVHVSANTLIGMKDLMKQRGNAFSKVNEADKEVLKEAEDEIIEGMTDEESAQEAYGEAIENLQEAVYDKALSEESYIDVKALQHTHIALSVAARLADSETYEVPVTIGGQVTSINLKIVHNSSEEANVVVSFETDKLGRISARLNKADGEIKGYISCNLQETLSKMQEVADKLGKEVYTVMSGRSDSDSILSKIPMMDNDKNVSSAELYETAKAFLEAVKGIN